MPLKPDGLLTRQINGLQIRAYVNGTNNCF